MFGFSTAIIQLKPEQLLCSVHRPTFHRKTSLLKVSCFSGQMLVDQLRSCSAAPPLLAHNPCLRSRPVQKLSLCFAVPLQSRSPQALVPASARGTKIYYNRLGFRRVLHRHYIINNYVFLPFIQQFSTLSHLFTGTLLL